MGVDGFGGVGVEFGGVDAAADRDADRHGDRHRAPGAGAHAGGMVDELVVGRSEEAVELDLGDGLHAGNGQADGAAHDAGLVERGVDDAVLAVLGLQAVGDAEDAAIEADVLAKKDHIGVGGEGEVEGVVDGTDEGHLGHGGFRSPLQPITAMMAVSFCCCCSASVARRASRLEGSAALTMAAT